MYLKFYKINCHNISAVLSNSLYAASPLKFNDPFEDACKIEEATQMAIANILHILLKMHYAIGHAGL